MKLVSNSLNLTHFARLLILSVRGIKATYSEKAIDPGKNMSS